MKSRKSLVAFTADNIDDDHQPDSNNNNKHRTNTTVSSSSSSPRIRNANTSVVSPHLLQQRAQMSLLRRKLLPVIGLRRFQHARRTQRENILASIMEQHQQQQRIAKFQEYKSNTQEEAAAASNEENKNKNNAEGEAAPTKTFITETNNKEELHPGSAIGTAVATSRPATGSLDPNDPLSIFRNATTTKTAKQIIDHSQYLKHWGKDVLEQLLSLERAALERFCLADETIVYPHETCFSHGLLVLVHGSLVKIPKPSETVMKQHFNHLAQQRAYMEESLNNNSANSGSTSGNTAAAAASARKRSMLLQKSPLNLTNTNPDSHIIKAPAVIGEELVLSEGLCDYYLKADTYCQYIFVSPREIHKKLLELSRSVIAKTLPPPILVSREVTLRQHFKQTPPLLRCSWITKDMEPKTLYRLMLDLEPRSFLPGEDIAKEGSVAPWMVFIRRGEAELMSSEVVVMKLKAGDTFGEMSVLFGEPRLNTLRSTTICDVWILHRKSVGNILRMADSQRSVVRKAAKMRRVLLEQLPRVHSHAPLRTEVPYLRGMPDAIFEKMVHHSKAHVFPVGLLMVASSETCDALVLIVQGSCVSQDVRHFRFHGGDVLGMNCLIPHRWTHGISAVTMVDSFILARPHLVEALKAWGEYKTALRYVNLEMRELKRSLTKDLLLNPPPSNIATSTVMDRQALRSVLDGNYTSSASIVNSNSGKNKDKSSNDNGDDGEGEYSDDNTSNNGSLSNSARSSSSATQQKKSSRTLTQDEKREQQKIAIKKQRFKVRVSRGFRTMIGGDSSSGDDHSDDENNNNKKRKNNHYNHHHSGNPFKNQITDLIAKQKLGTALSSSSSSSHPTNNNRSKTNNNNQTTTTFPPLSSRNNTEENNSNNNASSLSPLRGQQQQQDQQQMMAMSINTSVSNNSMSGYPNNNTNYNLASGNTSTSSPPNNNNSNNMTPSASMISNNNNNNASSSSMMSTTANNKKIRSAKKLQEVYQGPDDYRQQLHDQHGQHDLPRNVVREVQQIEQDNRIREKAIQKRNLKQQQVTLMNMMKQENNINTTSSSIGVYNKDEDTNNQQTDNMYNYSPSNNNNTNSSSTNNDGNNNNNNSSSSPTNNNNASAVAFVDVDEAQHLGALKFIWSNPRYDRIFSDRQDIAKLIAPWPSATHVYWLNQKLRDEDPHQQEKRKKAAASMRDQMLSDALDHATSKRQDVARYSISLPTKLLEQQQEFESSRMEQEEERNSRARRMSLFSSGSSHTYNANNTTNTGEGSLTSSPTSSPRDPESFLGRSSSMYSNLNPKSSVNATLTGISARRRRSSIASVEAAERRNSMSNQQRNGTNNNSPVDQQQQYSSFEEVDSLNNTQTLLPSNNNRDRKSSFDDQQQRRNSFMMSSSFCRSGSGAGNFSGNYSSGSGTYNNNTNNNKNYSYNNYYNTSNAAYTAGQAGQPPPLVTPEEVEVILGGLLASVPARVRQQFEFDEIGEEGTRVGGGTSQGNATHRTNASSNNRWVPSEMNRDFLMEEIEDLSLNVDSELPIPKQYAVYDEEVSKQLPTGKHFRAWVAESVKKRIKAAREKARQQYEEQKIERRNKLLEKGVDPQVIMEEEEQEDREHALLFTEMTDDDWDVILSTSSISTSQLLEDPDYYLDRKRRRDQEFQTKQEQEKRRKQEQEEARVQKEKDDREKAILQLQQQKNQQNVPSYARGTAGSLAKSKQHDGRADAMVALAMMHHNSGGSHHNTGGNHSSDHHSNTSGHYHHESQSGEGKFSMKAILDERARSDSTGEAKNASADNSNNTELSKEEKEAREKRRKLAREQRRIKKEKKKSREQRRAAGEENVSDDTDEDDDAAGAGTRRSSVSSYVDSDDDDGSQATNSELNNTARSSSNNNKKSTNNSRSSSNNKKHSNNNNTHHPQHQQLQPKLQPQPPKTARGRRLAKCGLIISSTNNNTNASSVQDVEEHNNNNDRPHTSRTTMTTGAASTSSSSLFKTLESTFVKRPLEKNSNYIRTARPKHSARLGWAMVPSAPPPRNKELEGKEQQESSSKNNKNEKNENKDSSSSSVSSTASSPSDEKTNASRRNKNKNTNDNNNNSSRNNGGGGGVNNAEDDADHYAILKNVHPGHRQVPPSPTKSVSTATTAATSSSNSDDDNDNNDNDDEARSALTSPKRDVGVVHRHEEDNDGHENHHHHNTTATATESAFVEKHQQEEVPDEY